MRDVPVAVVRDQARPRPQEQEHFIPTGLNELDGARMGDALCRFSIDFNNLVTNVNPAVLEGGPVLGQAQDEEPHVVLLPPAQAEPEAAGAPLQLHRVAAQALVVPTAHNGDHGRVGLRQVLVVRPRVSVRSGRVFPDLTVPRCVVGLRLSHGPVLQGWALPG